MAMILLQYVTLAPVPLRRHTEEATRMLYDSTFYLGHCGPGAAPFLLRGEGARSAAEHAHRGALRMRAQHVLPTP